MREGLSIPEVARAVPCSHWTVRAYLKRGIVCGTRDERGRWQMGPETPRQVREHMNAHGGPGGRPLLRRT